MIDNISDITTKSFRRTQTKYGLLTKLVWPRWLDIGLVLFFRVYGPWLISVHKHTKKELGQYPAILTSHLVNNSYLVCVRRKDFVVISDMLSIIYSITELVYVLHLHQPEHFNFTHSLFLLLLIFFFLTITSTSYIQQPNCINLERKVS